MTSGRSIASYRRWKYFLQIQTSIKAPYRWWKYFLQIQTVINIFSYIFLLPIHIHNFASFYPYGKGLTNNYFHVRVSQSRLPSKKAPQRKDLPQKGFFSKNLHADKRPPLHKILFILKSKSKGKISINHI